jgi:hypothetical protein
MNVNSDTSLTVDFSKPNGCIKLPLHGANFGPLYCSGALDCSADHRELGLSHIRTHDCPYAVPGSVDVHSIFPLFHRDADDPQNYRFRVTDDYLQAIVDAGEKIYYRLGESIEHHTRAKYWIHPPPDYGKWAQICVNIIRHYNDGWADGFRHGIEYWEIWNEPANGRRQWTGTREEFFRLYAVAARAIKKYEPRLKVGGCSIAGDWVAPFLEFCVREHLPLDFYSVHWYGYRHEGLGKLVAENRKLLDDAGYSRTEIHLNEWNYLPPGITDDWLKDPNRIRRTFARMSGSEGASFDASALVFFHDLPLDMAMVYRASEGLYGMFDSHGERTKVFYAFKAFGGMIETPLRVAAEGGNVGTGLAVLAGRSEDGSVARVLASNYQHPCGAVEVAIQHLPWRGPSVCRIHVLDAHHDLELVQTMNQPAGNFAFRLHLPPCTVATVDLRQA